MTSTLWVFVSKRGKEWNGSKVTRQRVCCCLLVCSNDGKQSECLRHGTRIQRSWQGKITMADKAVGTTLWMQ